MKKCDLCGESYADYFIACPDCVLGSADKSKNQNKDHENRNKSVIKTKYYLLLIAVICVISSSIWGAEILIILAPCAAIFSAINSNLSVRIKTLMATTMSALFLFIICGLSLLIGIGEAWSGQGGSHALPGLLLLLFFIFMVFVVAKLIVDHDKKS